MWVTYAKQMVTTFDQYWPAQVQLRLYTEGFQPHTLAPAHHVMATDLYEAAPWLPMFKTLYSDPKFRGMVNGKHNYRFDAVKFAHKIAAIGAAAEGDDCDVLIWMDADIVTHAQVTTEWLDKLLPLSATIAMIEREKKYPECGYLMFRIPSARKVIRQIVNMYRTGAIFDLDEWHDSFVIGHVVKKAVAKGDAVVAPLAPLDLPKKHPFVNCVLAEKIDHLKGGRKVQGKSHRSDLVKPRPEPYWR